MISVAGTNGKGSCVAIIEALAVASGAQVGAFTSPHLLAYNERIRINARAVGDSDICRAFAAIERVRGETSLSYFEFSTLAALYIFAANKLDLIVLEVGLGGRLDAVNIIDPDVAVITSIDLDHQEWLGEGRSTIAREKAGIARADRPLVCTEEDLPEGFLDYLGSKRAELIFLGQDGFEYSIQDDKLNLSCHSQNGQLLNFNELPLPYLPIPSAIAAVQAVLALPNKTTGTDQGVSQFSALLDRSILEKVFLEARLSGRFQQAFFRGRWLILDVAHNPAAANLLAERLAKENISGLHGVFGILVDKDIRAVIAPLLPLLKSWHLCSLPEIERSADVREVAELVYNLLRSSGESAAELSEVSVQCYDRPKEALDGAIGKALQTEAVIVFGSFYTVAAALALVQQMEDSE